MRQVVYSRLDYEASGRGTGSGMPSSGVAESPSVECFRHGRAHSCAARAARI
jgi:hypothetical protein